MDRDIQHTLLGILSELGSLEGLDQFRRDTALELASILKSQNDEAIQKCYCSGLWWGGAGSMFDFSPDRNRRRYMELLIALVRGFEAARFDCSRASDRVAIFQEWLDRKII